MMMGENRYEITDPNVICEAAECYSRAKFNISAKVGTKGKISLFVCENCISKFTQLNWVNFETQFSHTKSEIVPLVPTFALMLNLALE